MTSLGSLLLTVLAPGTPPPADWTPEMKASSAAVNRVTFDLYAKLPADDKSRFASPFSLATAFAMLADAARGPARDELVKAFHLPEDVLAAGDLAGQYTRPGKPYTLTVANALWGQTGFNWNPGYQKRLKDRFAAELAGKDFRGDPDGSRLAVNQWVERRTGGRIKDLLPTGSVTTDTRFVLGNAVYFKGAWAEPFRPAATRPQPFTRADGAKAEVPLMTRTGSYPYAKQAGFQVLELPYAGDELAMDVFLPDAPAGLAAVEAKLSADAVAGWLAALQPAEVEVHLPKFRVEAGGNVNALVKQLGVTAVFDAGGLAGLTEPEGNDLMVTDVFHKAFVEVAEAGTEAAAASGIIGAVKSVPPERAEPVRFRADHSYLFLIRDVKHGTVLFVGRYTGP